jgi:hypothetical protein
MEADAVRSREAAAAQRFERAYGIELLPLLNVPAALTGADAPPRPGLLTALLVRPAVALSEPAADAGARCGQCCNACRRLRPCRAGSSLRSR